VIIFSIAIEELAMTDENSSPISKEPSSFSEQEMFKHQYLLMRQKYETKIVELSLIKELVDTLRLTGVFERNVIFSNQLKIIKQRCNTGQVHLLLSNNEQFFELVATTAEREVHAPPHQLSGKEGLLERLIACQNPIICTELATCCSAAELQLFKGKSCLVVPVMQSRTLVGVLALTYEKICEFDSNKINFFNLVADEIATAAVLTRLYGQMLKEESKRNLLCRFFSKNVTDEILGGSGTIRLGGERRMATIIFADLHGFTSLSESLDQDEVVRILNAFFSALTPIIFKYDGTLDKLLGDGLMAIFGAPISHGDDVVRALTAVIEMVLTLKSFNKKHRANNWPALKIGIGVNTGEVVAGYIGSEAHLNYTVVGDAVNVAQRIQMLASDDEILISRSVREAIGEHPGAIHQLKGLTELSPQRVKGKKEALDIFRVEY
jgi:adenylate cyclase